MRVRRCPVLVLPLVFLVAIAGRDRKPVAPEPGPTLPPATGRFEVAAATGSRTDAVLPGPIVAALILPPSVRGGGVWLLVRAEGDFEGPRSLHFLEARPGGLLTDVLTGLSADVDGLFAGDLDGDGALELLLGGSGRLDTLGPVAEVAAKSVARPVLRRPGFEPASFSPRPLRAASAAGFFMGSPVLASAEAGNLSLDRRGPGGWGAPTRVTLPRTVMREATGLRFTSPAAALLEDGTGSADGTARFAVGPEANGDRRLRTVLIDVDVSGVAITTEAWSRLPSPEAVEVSRTIEIDGKPVLIALTQTAGKLGLFENRKLRVFALAADRTRSGKGPMLSVETGAPRWHDPEIHVQDLDGDGKQDLLLIYPKGLSSPELALEAFPGLGGANFAKQPRRSILESTPWAWLFGRDLTGDGRPDLVAAAGDAVSWYAGAAESRRLVESNPRFKRALRKQEEDRRQVVAAVGTGGAEVREEVSRRDQIEVADLDGDGSPEILVLSTSVQGRGVLQVVRLR